MLEEKAKNLLQEFQEKIIAARGKKFVFLLVGRTGVRKSSTVIAASLPSEQCEEAASRRIEQIEDFIDSLTRYKGICLQFRGFQDCWLVDNLVQGINYPIL